MYTLLCMIKILSVHNNLIRSRNKNYKYLSLIFIHLLNLFLDGSTVLFIKINQTLGIHTKALKVEIFMMKLHNLQSSRSYIQAKEKWNHQSDGRGPHDRWIGCNWNILIVSVLVVTSIAITDLTMIDISTLSGVR